MLTRAELAERVSAGRIDTVLAVFSDLYGRLMGKRFDAGFFLEHTAEAGSHACDYLLTVDMEMKPVGGYRFANWERGYGDFHLVPDAGTRRVASWLDKTAVVLCANGGNRIWYAGAWLGDGLQEGAVASAERVAVALGGRAIDPAD